MTSIAPAKRPNSVSRTPHRVRVLRHEGQKLPFHRRLSALVGGEKGVLRLTQDEVGNPLTRDGRVVEGFHRNVPVPVDGRHVVTRDCLGDARGHMHGIAIGCIGLGMPYGSLANPTARLGNVGPKAVRKSRRIAIQQDGILEGCQESRHIIEGSNPLTGNGQVVGREALLEDEVNQGTRAIQLGLHGIGPLCREELRRVHIVRKHNAAQVSLGIGKILNGTLGRLLSRRVTVKHAHDGLGEA